MTPATPARSRPVVSLEGIPAYCAFGRGRGREALSAELRIRNWKLADCRFLSAIATQSRERAVLSVGHPAPSHCGVGWESPTAGKENPLHLGMPGSQTYS